MGGGLGFGYAGSVYDGLTQSYPLVPYSELDFNPSCTIDYEVRQFPKQADFCLNIIFFKKKNIQER